MQQIFKVISYRNRHRK